MKLTALALVSAAAATFAVAQETVRGVRLQPGPPARVSCALGWKPDHGGFETISDQTQGTPARRRKSGGGAK